MGAKVLIGVFNDSWSSEENLVDKTHRGSALEEAEAAHQFGDSIDLYKFFRVLWKSKWLVLSLTAVFAGGTGALAFSLPNVYRADALVAPNESSGGGSLSRLANQYGGLASLAGINLGVPAETDKATLGLAVLKSRRFLTEFIHRRGVLVPLMAASGWDSVTGELKIDSSEYDAETGKWVRRVRPPKSVVPSDQEAYESLLEILAVEQDEETGLVTISIDHYSPVVASQWVEWLIEDLNAVVLREDVTEAEQAIEYLNEQVDATSQAGLKEVFFRLIEEQTKTILLAKANEEYLLKTIDPAVRPEEKLRPNRLLLLVLGGLTGSLVGALFVFVSQWRHAQLGD